MGEEESCASRGPFGLAFDLRLSLFSLCRVRYQANVCDSKVPPAALLSFRHGLLNVLRALLLSRARSHLLSLSQRALAGMCLSVHGRDEAKLK